MNQIYYSAFGRCIEKKNKIIWFEASGYHGFEVETLQFGCEMGYLSRSFIRINRFGFEEDTRSLDLRFPHLKARGVISRSL